jgi:excisionase family DNA binding protein
MSALEILTVDEAAARLKVTRRVVLRLCFLGRLPGARKVGRYWRVPSTAIAAFFGASSGEASEDAALDEDLEAPVAETEASTNSARTRRSQKARRAAHPRGALPNPATDRAGFLRILKAGGRSRRHAPSGAPPKGAQ